MEQQVTNYEPYVRVGGWAKFRPSEMVMLKAEVNYTKIFTSDGNNYLVALPLKELERRLTNFAFFRPHKSFLINLDYIIDFSDEKDDTVIFLLNEWKINVSRRKKEAMLKIVEDKFLSNFTSF